jgi:tRNA1Val (adenine37-N6)-methyltransferase
MSKPFRFKRFFITDQNSAMKVNTDGVLLGAWTRVEHAKGILDVGTGSGLIAIMLAQRSATEIDAIDIHEPSCEDAKTNFSASPWKNRLHIFHQSLHDFSKTCGKKYDLIVSNPPFHNNSLKSPYQGKNLSKHTINMAHKDLIRDSIHILSQSGRLSIILPATEYLRFSEDARTQGLHCTRECRVLSKPGKKPVRMMMEFEFQKTLPAMVSELIIRNTGGDYHEDYKMLTKDFYLHF